MNEDVGKIHDAFKGHVAETRDVDLDSVATGEVWLGADARERGLVDELATSDEVLASKMQESDVIEVTLAPQKKGFVQLLEQRMEAAESAVAGLWARMSGSCHARVALESDDPKANS